VNAAFLLVTSAWFAGQTPAPAPVAPPLGHAPAVVSTASGCNSGSCGSACDSCCDSGGGFFSRFKGMFHRNKCDSCDSCGGGHTWGGRLGGHRSCDTCNTNTCDSGCGHSLFGGGGRLRGLFHRNKSDCCDTCDGGCGTGCGAGAVGGYGPGVVGGYAPGAVGGYPTPVPAQSGEQLVNPPKKMPTTNPPPVVPAPQKQVRINNTPITTPAVPVTPNIEVVPPPVPSLEAERRDPPF
jgi:hypothetical protein